MISTIISSLGPYDIFYLLITFVILYVSRYYYHYFTRLNPLPGPFPLPVFGNAHQKLGHELNDWLASLHKKYGDMFEVFFAGQRTIVLCNTDLIENMNVPSAKTTKYPHRNLTIEGFKEYGIDGTGIVNNIDPKSWKYNRQFFTQAIMTPSFNQLAIEWTNELWIEMESYWNNLGENRELDLLQWMHRFTNEIIFKVSTGIKNNAVSSYYLTLITHDDNNLSEEEKEKIKESENLVQSLEILLRGSVYFLIFNKFMRHYIPFIRGKVNRLLKNRDYYFNKIYDIIKKRRVEIENTPLDQPLRHDMLTTYIIANTSRDTNSVRYGDADLLRPMTDKEIFGNIFDAMAGGTETTANLLCFVAYYLGHYPQVKQRLLQELDEVLGNDFTKPITSKHLDELQYCDAVIKEVYRHIPIFYSIGRVGVEKDVVGGFNWPEKTSFLILYSVLMRRKDYWTEPEKFDPDRFYKLEESDKYLLEKRHVKNSFAVFGGGIRICPGRKLAMAELKCLLASIYRKYDIEMVDANAPLNYVSGLLTVCKELLVKIKPRKF